MPCQISAACLLTLAALASAGDCEKLFVARPLTAAKSFTDGIEGPNSDPAGNVYAVNFARQQTVGKVTPDGMAEVFVTLPGKSVGNGIVFDPQGMMYVADYVEHKVWKVDPRTRKMEVFAHDPKMNQPNDLAIAPDGTLYASDPNWKAKTICVSKPHGAGWLRRAKPGLRDGTARASLWRSTFLAAPV